MAGIAWFVLYVILTILLLVYAIHPKTNVSIWNLELFRLITYPLLIVVAIDGLRRPIPRLHFKGWALFFCLCLCLLYIPVFVIRQFLVQPFRVPTSTMQPTIMGMRKDAGGNKNICDNVFVNKMIYHLSEPERGDVVAFSTRGISSPFIVERNDIFIKRLVGLPGEKIRINPPNIVIDGVTLTNPPIFNKISEGKDGYAGYVLASPGSALLKTASDTITLGADEYFVLGDNSPNSLDSRFYGPITRKAILGKVFYIYAPADRKRKIE